jgi:peptide/nickel transport system substrate-binding protein
VIDEPGPWGTGPFTLVQGASSITTRNVIMTATPYAAAWLIESEQRTPELVLEANRRHWNAAARGPRVERAVFRNDLTPSEALELCLTTDGEVDIVTEVSPADAARVEASQYADLVTIQANRVLTCVIDRGDGTGPLNDVNVRRALNLAVNRERIIEEGLAGYATPLSALTSPWCSGFPAGAKPYDHDPAQAKKLWEVSGWPAGRQIRLATPEPFAGVAQLVANDLRRSLDVKVDLIVVPDEALPAGARALIEKKLPVPWDLLVHAWFDLSSEAPPAAVHREFFGTDGAFRAGPPDEGFDALYDEMKVQLDGARLVEVAERLDAYCFDQALAVYLCAPQALYAVNKHVSFGPYRTTFEIAEVTVDEQHWSRTGGGRTATAGSAAGQPARKESKPGFSGAAGNAC